MASIESELRLVGNEMASPFKNRSYIHNGCVSDMHERGISMLRKEKQKFVASILVESFEYYCATRVLRIEGCLPCWQSSA